MINKNKNIILIGIMGSGKSTIGKKISEYLNYDLLDTDKIIENKYQLSISQIFHKYGETKFRDMETQLLKEIKKIQNTIISTGGGIIVREENQKLLAKLGYIVWLRSSPQIIEKRIKKSYFNRPMINKKNIKDNITELYKKRIKYYREISDININTDNLSVEETATGITESANVFFFNNLLK